MDIKNKSAKIIRHKNGVETKWGRTNFVIYQPTEDEVKNAPKQFNRIHIKALVADVGEGPGVDSVVIGGKVKQTLIQLSDEGLFQLYATLSKFYQYEEIKKIEENGK